MAVDEYISTFTSSILMVLGWNLGSAKSARNFPRSLTSPSHSVSVNLSPIMLATAVESRETCAWFHMRSRPTNLVVSAVGTALGVCAKASVISRQQVAALMMELRRIVSISNINCQNDSLPAGAITIENRPETLRMSRGQNLEPHRHCP